MRYTASEIIAKRNSGRLALSALHRTDAYTSSEFTAVITSLTSHSPAGTARRSIITSTNPECGARGSRGNAASCKRNIR